MNHQGNRQAIDRSTGDASHRIYGSLETLSRHEQFLIHRSRGTTRFDWARKTLMILGVLSLTGFIGFATLTFQFMQWAFVPQSDTERISPEAVYVAENPEVELVSKEEWSEVKDKMHQFFKAAENGEATGPIILSEREVNAFLKHDTRLGPLRNAASLSLRNGQIKTIFDVNLGHTDLLGRRKVRFQGRGTFRAGIRGRELKVAVDALRVNGKDLQKWMHYVASANMSSLAKKGVQSVVNVPLNLFKKSPSPSSSVSRAVVASLDISEDSAGDIFRAISFGREGAIRGMVERLQLYSINQVFNVHSRLHDLLLSLDRVEIHDGYIKIYPNRPGLKWR